MVLKGGSDDLIAMRCPNRFPGMAVLSATTSLRPGRVLPPASAPDDSAGIPPPIHRILRHWRAGMALPGPPMVGPSHVLFCAMLGDRRSAEGCDGYDRPWYASAPGTAAVGRDGSAITC